MMKKSIQGRMFRKASFVLAGLVVFATTYSLILPALTLDYDSLSDLPGLHLGEKPVVVEVLNSESAVQDDRDFLSSGLSASVPTAGETAAVAPDSVDTSEDAADTMDVADKTASSTDQSVNATSVREAEKAAETNDTHRELLWVDKDADQAEIDRAVEDAFGELAVKDQDQPASESEKNAENAEAGKAPETVTEPAQIVEDMDPEAEAQENVNADDSQTEEPTASDTDVNHEATDTSAVEISETEGTTDSAEATDSVDATDSAENPDTAEEPGTPEAADIEENTAVDHHTGDVQDLSTEESSVDQTVVSDETADGAVPDMPQDEWAADEETAGEGKTSADTESLNDAEVSAEESVDRGSQSAEEPKTETWLENSANTKLEMNLTELTFDGGDYQVIAKGFSGTAIPDGAVLEVAEITQGTQDYSNYEDAAKAQLSDPGAEIVSQRFFDIHFLVNGEKAEPGTGVTVEIRFAEAQQVKEDQKLSVVHFTENSTDVVQAEEPAAEAQDEENLNTPTETSETRNPETAKEESLSPEILETTSTITEAGVESVSFKTGSFSVFGVVYTVNFQWNVDGVKYSYSIPGGGCFTISDLAEIIGVTEKIDEFIADIADVTFSDPSVAWINKVDEDITIGTLKQNNNLEIEYSPDLTNEEIDEVNSKTIKSGDWVLISLKPFDSEENLCITMKNGEVWSIRVVNVQEEHASLIYEDNKLKVSVKELETDSLPKDAVLKMREIYPDEAENADIYSSALTALTRTLHNQDQNYTAAYVFDLSLYDKTGYEIEPEGKVSVNIEFKDKPNLSGNNDIVSDLKVAHIVEASANEDEKTAEILDSKIDATDSGIISTMAFDTDSFSAYIVFNENQIHNDEPTDLGQYGWIRFHTVGDQDTTPNQTANPDSTTIQWGYYKNDGSNLPAVNTNWAYRRILKVRLWLPKSGQDSSVYDSDHYNEAATAQYFWVWQNEVSIEEFELPGYEVVHTRMHTAWDEENGKIPVENDSLVGTYNVRGYRHSTISNEPGAKNSDLNVLDVYVKPMTQTNGMHYVIRYVHADGSVTDGNVRSLSRSSGNVIYDPSTYQRNGEVYAGTSIVTGTDAITLGNDNRITITYKADVSLAKVYVYYKIDPTGNGNPGIKGRYDKDEKGYYTGEKGLYTDKSAEAVANNNRQFILNLESWYVDNAASVGMVLDASGSMAWTSGAPEPVILTNEQLNKYARIDNSWKYVKDYTGDYSTGTAVPDNSYIPYALLSQILDKNKTDNSSMGYNGYHYYLKDERSTVREYVALGYTDGNLSDNTWTRLKGSSGYNNGNGRGFATVSRWLSDNDAGGKNEGWYYVNSTGRVDRYLEHTGKSYDGYAVPTNSGASSKGPLRFYVKNGNELWVAFYDSTNKKVVHSPVYEKRDKMFTKMETLQDAVSQFGAIVLGSSPDSQIAMTRFSQNIVQNNSEVFTFSSYLPLLNWTGNTVDVAGALTQSSGSYGGKTKNDKGLTVYEYGLTGQTRTWTGVKAYSDYLKSSATVANHKYLVIFTDGKDTNGDADKPTGNPPWGETGKQVQALKNDGYTIITVMMRSQAMDGNEYTTSKAFLQGIASPGLDGNASNTSADNKLYFEADSNSTKDVIDAFRKIANKIASGLNGYIVRDYIDPRFDVINDAGDILSVLDSNGQFTHETNPDIDEATGLRGFTTPDNKHAYLGYDPVKKMFYVLWKDQEIPASTIESRNVNPWKSQLRIQAKEDFLGGNDILSNGNESGMNQVYYPNASDPTGMTPVTNNTNYPSKDFPKTTTNPGTLEIELDNYEDTIFLGENISPASLYAAVQTKRNQETDNRELYFDYLVRVGNKLHNDPQFYLNILKYAAVPDNYEQISVKDRDGTTPLETVALDGNVKGVTLTLPYYYLESPGDVASYAGGTLHQGDKIGTVTYKWTALSTGGHTLTDGNALIDYTSSITDTVRYQLSVSYTPDTFISNHIETNKSIVGDSISDNGSARTQTLIGETGTGSLIRDPEGVGSWAVEQNTNKEGVNKDTQGLAAIHVVDGKFKASKRIEISEDAWSQLVTSAGESGLTFTFQLKKNGENYGDVITINSKTAGVTSSGGFVTLETTDWVTGLPQGDYTLVETGQPAGFLFKSVTAAAVEEADGGIQFIAPTEGSVTWKIGRYVGGTPSTCSYTDTDFSAEKVKDDNKEVDPDKSASNGKNYLNAQIGKGIVENDAPKTIDVTLKKVDKSDLTNNSANLLKGATFTITKYTDNTFSVKDTSASAWSSTLEDKKVGDSYTLNGNFEFKSLPVGFYKVDESVVPAGYVALNDAPVFEIRENGQTSQLEVILYKKNGSTYSEVASGSTDMARIDAVNTIYIANEPGSALPATGGPGTMLMFGLGAVVAEMTGFGILSRRRKKYLKGQEHKVMKKRWS